MGFSSKNQGHLDFNNLPDEAIMGYRKVQLNIVDNQSPGGIR